MNSLIKKMGTMGAGVVLTLAFIACSWESGNESAKSKKVKQKFDAELLSFEQAQKEVSLKDRECLKEPGSNERNFFEYRFIKTSSGDIRAILIADAIKNPTNDSFMVMGKGMNGKGTYSIDEVKTEKPQCFN